MGPRCNALVKPAIDKPPFPAFLDHPISSVELRLLDAMKITDRYRHVWVCGVSVCAHSYEQSNRPRPSEVNYPLYGLFIREII
jgi:hypothetical protein